MPCGGCGGGDIRPVARKSAPPAPRKAPVQLRPKPLSRLVPGAKPKKRKRSRVVGAARARAQDMRLCPICGASLSIEITGKTRRKRFRCNRCHKTYT